MRRNIGLVLAGLGAFLIVLAVVLPTWIVGQVVKFPLNEYQSATLAASNASYFSAKTLTEQTGVNLQATYTIKGDGTAGTSSTAVWNEYSYVYDRTNHYAVQQTTRRFAFDRKTGELTMCCGANVNGDSSVQQRGLVGYVFPFGTKKQTYQVFDITLDKPVPFPYAGTATVRGVTTYKFTEDIAPTQVATQTVPGSLVGMSAASVTLPEYYEIHLTYYVDPVTGALVNVEEHQTMSLHNPSTGAQALLLFDADLKVTPAALTTIVKLDTDGRSKLNLLKVVLPLALGIAGVIALVAGLILGRRQRPTMEDELTEMSRAYAAAPALEGSEENADPDKA